MAFQPVPRVAQIKVEHIGVGQLANSEAEWSLYVKADLGSMGQTFVDNVADAVEAWLPDYDAILSDDWHVTRVFVQDLGELGGVFAERIVDVPGTLAGDPAPPNCAMFVRFRGESGGEPLRGGVFLPVGSEASLDGNNWLAAFRTTADTAFDLLFDALAGVEGLEDHVLVSRYKSLNDDVKDARQALRDAIAATRRAEGVSNAVSDRIIRAQIASQRDRRGD